MKFDIAKVKLATQPLAEVFTKQQIESLVQGPVEACSDFARYMVGCEYHGLISTAAQAFKDHRPLCLSPDHIWLTIAQGFAQHVNNNAEEMRHNFVKHQGKVKIIVQRNEFIKGSPENNWEGVFDEFGMQIREHVGGATYSLVVSDFSTTTPTDRAASEIVLMDSMKSYFKYEVLTLCGIPSVELEGSVEDWERLREKVIQLQPFIPEWWYNDIDKVAYEFVQAAKGKIDKAWWNSLYNLFGGSGGDTISGWLVTLIPYVKSHSGLYSDRNPAKADGNGYSGDVSANDLPSSLSKVPFIWQYYADCFDYEFVAGIIGSTQGADLTLRPKIGWAVLNKENADDTPPVKKARVECDVPMRDTTVLSPLSTSAFSNFERLDIPARLDELRSLQDGWLDGHGVAPSPEGLDWLANTFDDRYPEDLPLPFMYPTVKGGIEAEWSMPPYEMSLEIDLSKKTGEWHQLNMDTDDEDARRLNLETHEDWKWLGDRVGKKGVA